VYNIKMKNTLSILGLVILLGGAAIALQKTGVVSIIPGKVVMPVGPACTMEAKLCPDGSSVGRTGPRCEFAVCPETTNPAPLPKPAPAAGILVGRVTLSPTCPVERMPPDPNCAPKGYATSIEIWMNGKFVKTIQSDSSGNFDATLSVGTYTLKAQGGTTLPRCTPLEVNIERGQTTNADISCDTGIR